jgi:hypothetical protein
VIDEHSGRRRGVFQAAADLVDANALPEDQVLELQSLRKWFGDHLQAPDRFSRSRKSNAAPKAIHWFKNSATAHVSRMHSICRILREHEIATEMITSDRPGYVVFEDEHQVAAIPFSETPT